MSGLKKKVKLTKVSFILLLSLLFFSSLLPIGNADALLFINNSNATSSGTGGFNYFAINSTDGKTNNQTRVDISIFATGGAGNLGVLQFRPNNTLNQANVTPNATSSGYGWTTGIIGDIIDAGNWTIGTQTASDDNGGIAFMLVYVYKNCSGNTSFLFAVQNSTMDILSSQHNKFFLFTNQTMKTNYSLIDLTQCRLKYEFFANITNNAFITSAQSLRFSTNNNQTNITFPNPAANGILNITMLNFSIEKNFTYHGLQNISVKITCLGGVCRAVNATIYFNSTSGTPYPNIPINATQYGKPFYNFTNNVTIKCGNLLNGETCVVSWLINSTGSISSEWLLNVTTFQRMGEQNSTPNFKVMIIPNENLSITLNSPLNIIVRQNKVFLVNATVTCGTGSCLDVQTNIFYNLTTNYPNTFLNVTFFDKPFYNFSGQSTVSCGNLTFMQTCNITAVINATNTPSSWLFNITANGTNFQTVSTINFNVTIISAGALSFTIITPLSVRVEKGNVFQINMSLKCTEGHCDTTNATLLYNSTSLLKPLNQTLLDKPFYNTQVFILPTTQNCGNLQENQTCLLYWFANATGDISTAWAFKATSNSTTASSNSSAPLIIVQIINPDNVKGSIIFATILLSLTMATVYAGLPRENNPFRFFYLIFTLIFILFELFLMSQFMSGASANDLNQVILTVFTVHALMFVLILGLFMFDIVWDWARRHNGVKSEREDFLKDYFKY